MKIKMLVMDVDGTLTDGRLYIGANGEVMKAFDVRDGYAIANILPREGIIPVIVTNRASAIVEQRAKELKVTELYQGIPSKADQIKALMEKYGLCADQIAYMGDDMTDLEPMHLCGMTACPSDAVEEIKEISDYVCNHEGGRGAVREFVEKMQERIN